LKKLNGRNLKALTLLAVVLPVSLLVSFRLTGILQEPKTISETITLETVRWEFQRPDNATDIFDIVEAFYKNDGLTTDPKILILDYVDRPYDGYYFDSLYMVISINATITNQDGFIESGYVVLQTDYQSPVGWLHTDFRFENLSLIDVEDWGWRGTKASVSLKSMNHPEGAYFSGSALYRLLTPNNQTHQLDASFELTYHNGTVYKKVVQPFQLRIIGK
jgi:hypothetical protein